MHCMGLFAVYLREVSVYRSRMLCKGKELACSLLAASPMAKPSGDTDFHCTAGATNFSASVHIRCSEDGVHIFGVNVLYWAMCQMADNRSVNACIADPIGIPHVGCGSHKLNVEVRAMISTDRVMQYTIDSVHSTMKFWKSGLENRALLRNLTGPNPVLNNEKSG